MNGWLLMNFFFIFKVFLKTKGINVEFVKKNVIKNIFIQLERIFQ